MKISVAQTKPVSGNIASNIEQHLKLIALAVANGADFIVFSELSLTGYEPELADSLATTKDDPRFDIFQEKSDDNNLTIGVGIPLRATTDITISMVVFQPKKPREVYTKYYLHDDELPYFVSEKGSINALGQAQEVALAICYEISCPEHAEQACNNKTAYYLASVAKTVGGVKKASTRLSEIASTYQIPVLMANCIGSCEGQAGGGNTGVWDKTGELLGAMDAKSEGIVVYDTETNDCTQKLIE